MTEKYYIPVGPRTAEYLESLDNQVPESDFFQKKGGMSSTNFSKKELDVYTVDPSLPKFDEFSEKILAAYSQYRATKRDNPVEASMINLLEELDHPEGFKIILHAGPQMTSWLQSIFSGIQVQEGKPFNKLYLAYNNEANLADAQRAELETYYNQLSSFTPIQIVSRYGADYLNLFLFAKANRTSAKPEKPGEEEAPPIEEDKEAPPKKLTLAYFEEQYDHIATTVDITDGQIEKNVRTADLSEVTSTKKANKSIGKVDAWIKRLHIRRDRAAKLCKKASGAPESSFIKPRPWHSFISQLWTDYPTASENKKAFRVKCQKLGEDIDAHIAELKAHRTTLVEKKKTFTFIITDSKITHIDHGTGKVTLTVYHEGGIPKDGVEFRHGNERFEKARVDTSKEGVITFWFKVPKDFDIAFWEFWESGDSEKRLGVFKISIPDGKTKVKEDFETEFIEEKDLFSIHLPNKSRKTMRWLKGIFKDTSFQSTVNTHSIYFDKSNLTSAHIKQLRLYSDDMPKRAGNVERISKSRYFGPEYFKLYEFAKEVLAAEDVKKDKLLRKVKPEWFPITNKHLRDANTFLDQEGKIEENLSDHIANIKAKLGDKLSLENFKRYLTALSRAGKYDTAYDLIKIVEKAHELKTGKPAEKPPAEKPEEAKPDDAAKTAAEEARKLAESKAADKKRKAEVDAIKAKLKEDWFPISKADINAARKSLGKESTKADVHGYFHANIDSKSKELAFDDAKAGLDDLNKKTAESVLKVIEKAVSIRAADRFLLAIKPTDFPFTLDEIQKAQDKLKKTAKPPEDVVGRLLIKDITEYTKDTIRTFLISLINAGEQEMASDTIRVLAKAVAMRAAAKEAAPPAPAEKPAEPAKPAEPEKPVAPPKPKEPTPAQVRTSLNKEFRSTYKPFDDTHKFVRSDFEDYNFGVGVDRKIVGDVLERAYSFRGVLEKAKPVFEDIARRAKEAPKDTFHYRPWYWFIWPPYWGNQDSKNRGNFVSKCEKVVETIDKDLADLDTFIANLQKPPKPVEEAEPEVTTEELSAQIKSKWFPISEENIRTARNRLSGMAGKGSVVHDFFFMNVFEGELQEEDAREEFAKLDPATASGVFKVLKTAAGYQGSKPASTTRAEPVAKPELEGVAARAKAADKPPAKKPAPEAEPGETPDWQKKGDIETDEGEDPINGIHGVPEEPSSSTGAVDKAAPAPTPPPAAKPAAPAPAPTPPPAAKPAAPAPAPTPPPAAKPAAPAPAPAPAVSPAPDVRPTGPFTIRVKGGAEYRSDQVVQLPLGQLTDLELEFGAKKKIGTDGSSLGKGTEDGVLVIRTRGYMGQKIHSLRIQMLKTGVKTVTLANPRTSSTVEATFKVEGVPLKIESTSPQKAQIGRRTRIKIVLNRAISLQKNDINTTRPDGSKAEIRSEFDLLEPNTPKKEHIVEVSPKFKGKYTLTITHKGSPLTTEFKAISFVPDKPPFRKSKFKSKLRKAQGIVKSAHGTTNKTRKQQRYEEARRVIAPLIEYAQNPSRDKSIKIDPEFINLFNEIDASLRAIAKGETNLPNIQTVADAEAWLENLLTKAVYTPALKSPDELYRFPGSGLDLTTTIKLNKDGSVKEITFKPSLKRYSRFRRACIESLRRVRFPKLTNKKLTLSNHFSKPAIQL